MVCVDFGGFKVLFLPFVIPCGSQRLCNEGAVTEGWGGTFLHTKGGGQKSCERGTGLSPLPVPPAQVSQRGAGIWGLEQKSLAWNCSIQNFPESLRPQLGEEAVAAPQGSFAGDCSKSRSIPEP